MALKSAPHFTRRRQALTRALVISTTALFLVTTPVAVSMAQPADATDNSSPSQVDDRCDPATSTTTTTPTSTTPATATSVPCTPAVDDKPAPSSSTAPAQKTPAATTAPTTTASAPSSEAATTSPAPQQKAPAGEWKPTENPQSTIVPGQMRSDREEVPAPFTKEDADRAEVAEARLRTSRNATACQIYWPSWFNVCGEIKAKYDSLGGPGSFLSYPSSGNLINPGNTGERVTFLNGPIYWSNAGGAHPVVNSILNRWGVHGYEAGWLGYPTTDEIVHADGVGRRQEFQNGAVYVAFSNAIGSAIKNGPIRDKWNSVGAETPGSLLGYITGDEIPLPDGQGRMARFERGVIYWSPTTGAHTVQGDILGLWEGDYFEAGGWGYPIADQVTQPNDGLSQEFQGGPIGTYKIFTREFEWQDSAETSSRAVKVCVFEGYTDYPHISGTPINGVYLKDRASVHAWWRVVSNCPPDMTAYVKVQFQTKSPDGTWVDRGGFGETKILEPTKRGGPLRAHVHNLCNGFGKKTWRGKVDVDVIGRADAPNVQVGYEKEIECS